jgi:hypothetical protein
MMLLFKVGQDLIVSLKKILFFAILLNTRVDCSFYAQILSRKILHQVTSFGDPSDDTLLSILR